MCEKKGRQLNMCDKKGGNGMCEKKEGDNLKV